MPQILWYAFSNYGMPQFYNYHLIQIPYKLFMKVEIVQSENISELDELINACITDRNVVDIKLSTISLHNGKIQYLALIMLV